MKTFHIHRVVTKDIVTDSFQGIRNLFGFRQRRYENMLDKHTEELMKEMNEQYKVKWFRMSINPLVTGSVMITLYGECE